MEYLVTRPLKRTHTVASSLILTFFFAVTFLSANDGPDYDFEVSIHVLAPLAVNMVGDQSFTATLGPLDPDPPAETEPIEGGGEPMKYPVMHSTKIAAALTQCQTRTGAS